jgi:hypothetical protein
MSRRLPVLLLLALLALTGLGRPGVAHANAQLQYSIMMDDDQLLYRGDAVRDDAMRRMKALGVDYVRVTVLWSVVAEHAKYDKKGKRRKNFKADDPRTYPKGNWDRYDRLVRAGRTLGIGVYLNVTGPGPRWAMGTAPKSLRKYQRTWEPKNKEFFKFVKAVGKRYDGTYKDENDAGAVLPRVSFWSIYNEPNQPGWLTPQWKGSTPWAPVMYRDLWRYGRTALDQTGHRDDIVLIGETAPLGSKNHNAPSQLYPKRFVREFFCVDSRNRPYTGAAAKRRHCETLKSISPLHYTAWGHHPYTKKLAPTKRDSSRDSVTIANISELPALLDAIAAKRPGTAPATNYVALTEFGYETKPPDPFSGVSLTKQAEYINTGDYIAYKDPRIIANTQFLLRDVAGIKKYKKSDKRHWFTYQSGLYFASGKPKPSAVAYRMPLMVTGKNATSTNLWGWVRFLPTGTAVSVQMQFKPAGTSAFGNVGDPVPIDANGFFTAAEPLTAPGTWRAVFVESISGTTITSREVPVS